MQPPRVRLDLSSVAVKHDPVATWRRLQAEGDVVSARIPLLGTPALAVRRAPAREVLEDESRFTVDARRIGRATRAGTQWWVPPIFRRLADNLLVQEGEAHRRLRRRVDAAFRRTALDALLPSIERRTDACLDELIAHPSPCFVREVARPLPLGVISDLLGLDPIESAPDRPLGRALMRLSRVRGALDLFRMASALRTIDAALREDMQKRRRRPRADLLTALLDDGDDDDPWSDDERIAMVFLLYVAGHETTTHLLSVGLWTLLTSRADGLQLLPIDRVMANELLRVTSPVEMSKPRFVIEDCELAGHRLRRGSTVAALIGAANHDDRVWPDSQRFDVERPPARHLGFGSGRHACLGLHLALQETETVFNALAERLPGLRLRDPMSMPAWRARTGLRALDSLPLALTPRLMPARRHERSPRPG